MMPNPIIIYVILIQLNHYFLTKVEQYVITWQLFGIIKQLAKVIPCIIILLL